MVTSGLGSGGVRRNKAIAQPARTFMLGLMAAYHNLGKCVEPTAADSLVITQKRGRLDPQCRISGEEKTSQAAL